MFPWKLLLRQVFVWLGIEPTRPTIVKETSVRRQRARAARSAWCAVLCLSLLGLNPATSSGDPFRPSAGMHETGDGLGMGRLGSYYALAATPGGPQSSPRAAGNPSAARQGTMPTGTTAASASYVTTKAGAPTNAAAPTNAGEPPMGLIIQLSTLQGTTSPATLKRWLEDIRTDHDNRSRPGYINSVVLQDIADQTGSLYIPYLDVIAPYLPGGATPIFERAYIGTVDLPWTGAGSKYIEGIESAAFRTQNIKISVAAASAFQARYPKTTASWYITYEANMAGFWDTHIEGAYGSYISGLMTALAGVAPNRAYLWSPAFWTMYANEPAWALPGLKTNLTYLFSHLPTHLTLDIQDFVGQSGGASSKESAAAWVGYLKQGWSPYLTKVQINAEQFQTSGDGTLQSGDAVGLPMRESYYASKGIELGPAWEIRFWHKRQYGN
jgi:hypothetical protein